MNFKTIYVFQLIRSIMSQKHFYLRKFKEDIEVYVFLHVEYLFEVV